MNSDVKKELNEMKRWMKVFGVEGIMENDLGPSMQYGAMGEDESGERYENIVFMQGDEADEPLEILNSQGPDAALEYLKQWHYSGEHMMDTNLGNGSDDKTYEKDGYIMAWNPRIGYIGLQYDTQKQNELKEEGNQNSDPTKEEMLSVLADEIGGFDSYDEFAAEEAIYWYAYGYHGGQNSNLYSVLSTSKYKPSPRMRTIEDSDDDMSIVLYNTLVSHFGGDEINNQPNDDVEDDDLGRF